MEESDLFLESWISPGERKRKKDKKGVKHKNSVATETGEGTQKKKKKKKNCKFKEAMTERKESKKQKKEEKEKKKKKKKKALVWSDDGFILTQCFSGGHAEPETEPSRLPSAENQTPQPPAQGSKQKTERKKKVAFDLSPGTRAAKRPKLTCPPPGRTPDLARDGESSQCSDDVNSQDLFITQKTFRASPPEPSSGEAGDEVNATPRRRAGPRLPGPQVRPHEGSNGCPWDSHFPRKAEEHSGTPERGQIVLAGKEEGSARHGPKAASVKREGGDVSPGALTPHLGDQLEVTPPSHAAESQKPPLNAQGVSKASASTQTENFFTTELCRYLGFCRRNGARRDTAEPLDLSLPRFTGKERLSANAPQTYVRDEGKRGGKKRPGASVPDERGGGGRPPRGPNPLPTRSSARRRGRVPGTRGEDKTPSPRSESESKSEDVPTSSEDNDPHSGTGRLDRTQVQTRLNESFFFKAKGGGQPVRPESPLMKLAQGRDTNAGTGR